MYGHWVKPDRFINFQDLYGVYLKKLKTVAYRFDDILGMRIERFHQAGIDGYILDAKTPDVISDYFGKYSIPAAQYKFKITSAEDTLAANLIPGSALLSVDGFDTAVVDTGNGTLRLVDGPRIVGKIDYATGKFSITFDKMVKAITAGTSKVHAGYATKDKTVKSAKFKNTVSGLAEDVTVNAIVGGQIPNSQVNHTLMIVYTNNSRKFFVGFTTDDVKCQAEIIKAVTGVPVTVTA